jgi:hypothetical protein
MGPPSPAWSPWPFWRSCFDHDPAAVVDGKGRLRGLLKRRDLFSTVAK